MPRNRPKEGKRVTYTQKSFSEALEDLSRGETLEIVSKRHGIPESTLSKHRNNTSRRMPGGGRKPILSDEDEESLAIYIKLKAEYGEGMTRHQVKYLVKNFITEAEIETRWVNNYPGDDWFNGFLKRHPDLVPRKAEQMPSYRVEGCDPFVLWLFYTDLKVLYLKYGITEEDGDLLWNADESAFENDPDGTYVLAEKGSKRVSKNIGGSGRENTTVLACGSASGKKMPPLIVYPGTYVWSSWIPEKEDVYPGTAYTAQKKGWMEGTLFAYWFEHVFLKNIPSKEDRRGRHLLLFFDGAKCHINARMIRVAQKNNVVLIKFPPNITQYIQPLDLCVFKSLKAEWRKILVEHDALTALDKKTFAKLLKFAWMDGFKARNLISGFKATGLFPIDFSKFPEKTYAYDKLERFKLKYPNAIKVAQPGDLERVQPTQEPRAGPLTAPAQTGLDTAPDQTSLSTASDRTGSATASDQASLSTTSDQTGSATAADQASLLTASDETSPATAPDQASLSTASDDASVFEQSTTSSTPGIEEQTSPSTGLPRRLSFEDFVRQNLRQNKQRRTSDELPEKRRKISQHKGEILTNETVVLRIEAEERERANKQKEKEERAQQKKEQMKRRKEEQEKARQERQKKKEERAKQKEEEKDRKKKEKEQRTKEREVKNGKLPMKKIMSKKSIDSSDESEDIDDPGELSSEPDNDPETFSDFERGSEEDSFEVQKKINIRLGFYYAISRDGCWYLGRVTDFADEDITKIMFMKSEVDKFIWPAQLDVQVIQNEQIFYGPLTLKGSRTFELARSDLVAIKSKFAQFKQQTKN